jgi:hypothetical protein
VVSYEQEHTLQQMQRTHANKWKTIGHGKLDGREEKKPQKDEPILIKDILHIFFFVAFLFRSLKPQEKRKRKEKEVLQCSAVQCSPSDILLSNADAPSQNMPFVLPRNDQLQPTLVYFSDPGIQQPSLWMTDPRSGTREKHARA